MELETYSNFITKPYVYGVIVILFIQVQLKSAEKKSQCSHTYKIWNL